MSKKGAMAASELDEPCDVSFSGTPLEQTLWLSKKHGQYP